MDMVVALTKKNKGQQHNQS